MYNTRNFAIIKPSGREKKVITSATDSENTLETHNGIHIWYLTNYA